MKVYKKVALVLLLALLVGGGYWVLRHFSQIKSNQAAPSTQAAKSSLPQAASPKHSKLDGRINALQERLKSNPDDPESSHQLASIYLQKVREVGDATYYAKVEALLHKALELQPNSFEAMSLMGALCLAQHKFRDALAWGERAKVCAPFSPYVYGVITDAHVELGHYEQAIETLQQMVNLRPDLSSYSRISYLRELMGDVEGAIEGMNMAINAGSSGTEARAWCRVQLGHLYFNSDKPNLADAEYQRALLEFPNYLHALAGHARVQAARRNYLEAVSLYTQVVQTMPIPEYVISLGDVYWVSGEAVKANQQYALVRVIAELHGANGVDTDLEIARFDADHNQHLPEALRRARQAFKARRSIYAADVLAWTLYKTGEYAEAYEMTRQALHLGTKDALLFFHAGMICEQLGKLKEARAYLEQALAINPHFSLLYGEKAERTLQDLQSEGPPKAAR